MLTAMNKEFRDHYTFSQDIAARASAYELAARMQLKAPAVVDFSKEPKNVQDLYGIGERKPTILAGSSCSLAASRKKAFVSSRFVTPAAATANGTRTAT